MGETTPTTQDGQQPTTPQGDGQQPGQPGQQQPEQQEPTAPLTWDTWLAGQDETVKGLLEDHTKGLKSALQSERDQRKSFEKQLSDLSKQAEEGSELRASLDKLADDVTNANARADFFEAAADPALGLRDARLAWQIVAANADEFTRRGKPDFDALKTAHPILFEAPPAQQTQPQRPTANAGRGTQGAAPPPQNTNEVMNNLLRGKSS